MPDEPKSNVKNETAGDLIRREIDRARNNLQCAMNQLGRSAIRAANPVPWFKRYPVKCSIATGVLLAGGAVAAIAAFRKKTHTTHLSETHPVHVYVKKPKPQSSGWGRVVTALLAAVSGKVAESLKTSITSSISEGTARRSRGKTVIVPNPQLRDVQI